MATGNHFWLDIAAGILVAMFVGAIVWMVQMLWIPITAAGIINGLGHWWGYRNFEAADASRNVLPWGVMIGGGGPNGGGLIGPMGRPIKALLMSQDIIAGIGNLYADETLYQTSIHPRRPVDELTTREIGAMFRNMRRILSDVIARKARNEDHPPRYLIHHREEGARCPRCGGTIRRTVVISRTTYFCGKHQR